MSPGGDRKTGRQGDRESRDKGQATFTGRMRSAVEYAVVVVSWDKQPT